jgi:hypothetical protein
MGSTDRFSVGKVLFDEFGKNLEGAGYFTFILFCDL